MAIKLRSGIFIPPFHPLDEDPTLCLQRDFELIEHLDRLGYDEAWIGEHHTGGYEIIPSPELFIAAAAERTKRIRLGTGVVSLPYHNPLNVADRMLQLDHQTRGRVMFGVGPGLLPSDAIQMGIDPTTQRDRMVEGLRALGYRVASPEGTFYLFPESPLRDDQAFVDLLAEIGEKVVRMGRDIAGLTAFLGEVVSTIGLLLLGKGRFRAAAVVTQMERVGLRGVPIVGLISFLVGAIIAQQTIFQLARFGADIYVVDLLGILMLREVGLLLASIMVAGRSGSAITAELGSMKMREEIDAMRVMGLNPMEVLILPRVIALVLTLPLLTFLSAMCGLFGGGLVAWLYGGITPITILDRLRDAIGVNTFVVGLVKAPAMALMIGTTACIEGMKVQGSAESLGRQTTNSVVKSIFTVIVVDGLFAMFFAGIRY